MKRWKRASVAFCCVASLTFVGCAKTANEPDIQILKEEAVTEQITQEETTIIPDRTPMEESVTIQEDDSTQGLTAEEETLDESVDYDLTKMGSDMVYATVYQMMVNPKDYEGKKVRVQGLYYGAWYEPTSQYYFYVIIQDALACCSQGIEFIWEDGNHVYPDEYPQDGSEVEVMGVFETYQEEGDETIYCRLRDSSLKVY